MSKHEEYNLEWIDRPNAICCVCGKKFRRPDADGDWGYWYDDGICCSFPCMREARARDRKEIERQLAGDDTPEPVMPKRQFRALTQEEKDTMIQMRMKGVRVDEIAERLDRTYETTRRVLKSAGMRVSDPRRKQTQFALLNQPQKVELIFELRRGGLGIEAISRKVGMSVSTVAAYLHGARRD